MTGPNVARHAGVPRRRRGFVLIFSMGILAVLSVLGITFVTLAQSDVLVGGAYADAVRARMLADAGFQRALAELGRSVELYAFDIGHSFLGTPLPPNAPPSWPWAALGPIAGGFVTASPDPSWPAWEPTITYGGPTRFPLLGDLVPPTAYGQAMPSLYAGFSGMSVGNSLQPNNRRAVSGLETGTYEIDGDSYVLRVVDCASQMYINGRQPNLNYMLLNLGLAISTYCLVANPVPTIAVANAIVAAREAKTGRVFGSKSEVRSVLIEQGLPNAYELLEPVITEQAWVDSTVLQARPQVPGNSPGGPGTPVAGGPLYQDLNFTQAPGGRAPVNLNTASVPVLAAVLAGLRGVRLTFRSTGGGRFEQVDPATGGLGNANLTITPPQALLIAQRIVNFRRNNPFRTWEQFERFLDWLVLNPSPGAFPPSLAAVGDLPSKIDFVKANANPNPLLNKFNPSAAVWRAIDKTDLCYEGIPGNAASRFPTNYASQPSPGYPVPVAFVWPPGNQPGCGTTEFCFSSMGYYEIKCLGRVTHRGGEIRSTAQIRGVVKLYDVMRYTTQAQFHTNSVPTSGQLQATDQLQSFPEPTRPGSAWNAGLAGYRHDVDGQVALRELNSSPQFPVAVPASSWNLRFFHDYVSVPGLNADTAAPLNWPGAPAGSSTAPTAAFAYGSISGPVPPANLPPRLGPIPSALAGSLFGSSSQNTGDLLPDGRLSMRMRAKVAHYDPKGVNPYPGGVGTHLHPQTGALEFWFKPIIQKAPIAAPGGTYPDSSATDALMMWVVPSKNVGPAGPPSSPAPIGFVFRLLCRRGAGNFQWSTEGGHYHSAISGGVNVPATTLFIPHPAPVDTFTLAAGAGTTSFAALSAGEWHHLAVSWNGYRNYRVYFDGALVMPPVTGSASGSGFPLDQIREMIQIGSGVNYVGSPAVGNSPQMRFGECTVDGVRVYYNQDAYGAVAPGPPSFARYPTTIGGIAYTTRFVMPSAVGFYRPLHLSATVWRPTQTHNGGPVSANLQRRIRIDHQGMAFLSGDARPANDPWPVANALTPLPGGPNSLTVLGFGGTNLIPLGTSGRDTTGEGFPIRSGNSGFLSGPPVVLAENAAFQVRAAWDDRNQTPRRSTPYLDDLTITVARVQSAASINPLAQILLYEQILE
ncbi:MAG: hypothetical protein HZA54_00760 [Planctomycetes bacterium]|nr:hypothetical protein [Planctomycetota bacterium]